MDSIQEKLAPSDVIERGLIKAKVAVDQALRNGPTYKKFDIDCGQLVEPKWEKGHKEDVKPYLKEISNIEKYSALYYLEILTGSTTEEILSTFRSYKDRKKETKRSTPAIKKHPPMKTKTLYVGKVKKNVWSRLRVHLGYYEKDSTSGLQLARWAEEIGVKLRVHVYYFDENMRDVVGSFELRFARSLKPLIGRH